MLEFWLRLDYRLEMNDDNASVEKTHVAVGAAHREPDHDEVATVASDENREKDPKTAVEDEPAPPSPTSIPQLSVTDFVSRDARMVSAETLGEILFV